MQITVREAVANDVDSLVAMYQALEAEQAALRPLWPLADGLDEPVADSMHAAIEEEQTIVLIASIDDVPLGFLLASPQPLLNQAGGRQVGTVRLIFTEPEARGVGVGAAMMEVAMERMRAEGMTLFDARVSPGHRNAKNFFEAHGFSARLIIMHHADESQ